MGIKKMSSTQIVYAGIGSRETPQNILELMHDYGIYLANQKYILRSGGAKGADRAFEAGCDAAQGLKEIYTTKSFIPQVAFDIAKEFHPAWQMCDAYARKLHARNSMIILGHLCNDPVDFVVCYSPGGFKKGGTSQGMRIAKKYNIPIYNLFEQEVYEKLTHAHEETLLRKE